MDEQIPLARRVDQELLRRLGNLTRWVAEAPQQWVMRSDIIPVLGFSPEEWASPSCGRCGHNEGLHDEKECMGGEDRICRCPGFEGTEMPCPSCDGTKLQNSGHGFHPCHCSKQP